MPSRLGERVRTLPGMRHLSEAQRLKFTRQTREQHSRQHVGREQSSGGGTGSTLQWKAWVAPGESRGVMR